MNVKKKILEEFVEGFGRIPVGARSTKGWLCWRRKQTEISERGEGPKLYLVPNYRKGTDKLRLRRSEAARRCGVAT